MFVGCIDGVFDGVRDGIFVGDFAGTVVGLILRFSVGDTEVLFVCDVVGS